jgi:hypothetical protein
MIGKASNKKVNSVMSRRYSDTGRVGLMLALLLISCVAVAAGDSAVLPKSGKVEIKSAGPLAFGPNGLLFVADPHGAAIVALSTNPPAVTRPVEAIKLEKIDQKIASLLGTTSAEIQIHDLAVQPSAGWVYLSVSRGLGFNAQPAIVWVEGAGDIHELPLDQAAYAKVSLNNAPGEEAKDRRGTPLRTESITDLAYVDGQLIVAGLSNEEFASKLRSIPFPFDNANRGTSVEIYHGAHGQFETRAPIRTFVPFDIGGKPHILAAYTCTPLVKFPLSDLKSDEKVRGITVAELGNKNRPLDLIVYQKEGRNQLLLANSARGVLKISTDDINNQQPITEKVAETAGLQHESIADLKGVEQLDKLNDQLAVVLIRTDSSWFNLESVALP